MPLVGAVEPLKGTKCATLQSQVVTNDVKLGLTNLKDHRDRVAEQALAVLQTVETDMTLFWRELANVNLIRQLMSAVRPNECCLSIRSDDIGPTCVFRRFC